jgi:hypothetical protein
MPAKTTPCWRRTIRREELSDAPATPVLSSTMIGAGCREARLRGRPAAGGILYAFQQRFKEDDECHLAHQAILLSVSTQDLTINPNLERFMAKRMGAKTIEINALIAQPDPITSLIIEALAVRVHLVLSRQFGNPRRGAS